MPTNRPRPIRTGQPHRTRRHLLAAATRLLADPGYTAVSSDRIAQYAGYTRGAVYRHFPSKADLASAVLDRVCELAITRTTRQLAALQHDGHLRTFEEFVQLVTSWIETLVRDPRWLRVEVALATDRRRHPGERGSCSSTSQRFTRLTTTSSSVLTATAAAMGHKLAVEPDTIAICLAATVLGMTIGRDDPDAAETIEPLVRHLLRSSESHTNTI
ncbi:TetR/AcrR family transcriptional regulator [Nocardia ninae]|uniref:TetR family transcriptional regulator n=1 Tax=Nocardia ninae NBRC 108245 TaxID=1210091 RepID=A0A511MJJ1_9NOCA|nr:TetR/AcrR family transcriptional regulator [Nocardia ninae]GEM40076.1 TetR family transcriptional regulator [Nocardia ninae NBRC 108245]